MNKNLWITNQLKMLKRIERYDELEKIKGILLGIRQNEKLRLIYVKGKRK